MNTPKLVLLIEDDSDIREALTQLLIMEGFTVHTASNGQEGLDYLSSAKVLPNVLLLDLLMPVKDGYEFLHDLRADPRLQNLAVVVLSANQMSDTSRLPGIRGFLKKPLDLDKLIATMRNAIG